VRSVIFKTAGGCAPLPGIERKSQPCARFVDEGFALALKPEVDTVVIAASWVGFVNRGDYYKAGDEHAAPLKVLAPQNDWIFQNLEKTLAKLTAAGKRVVVVLSSPRGAAFDPKSAIDREGMTVRISGNFSPVAKSAVRAITSPIDARIREIAARSGASVVDPADWLCGPSSCPVVDELGRPLYKDDSHLRASVARSRIEALDQYVYLTAPRVSTSRFPRRRRQSAASRTRAPDR